MTDTSGRATFRKKFHAWWEGYDLAPEPMEIEEEPDNTLLLTDRAPSMPEDVLIEAPGDALKIWPRWRVEAAEMIWGRDLVGPGDADSIVHLAKPLALNPALNLLDLTAQLGAGTRAIVESFGVWVTGLEVDPDLARDGHERSKAVGLDRKAPVSVYDPETFELKPKSFDCIMGRQPFLCVQNKGRMIETVQRGLRERGQVLFTEILSAAKGGHSPAVENWARLERRPPSLWSLDKMLKKLAEVSLDVRVDEDISQIYRAQVASAFATMVTNIENGTIPKYILPRVMGEVEAWAARIKAIEAGDIAVYRFHALNRGG